MERFEIEGKTITVFPAAAAGRPAIYLNVYGRGEGGVRAAMKSLASPDCTLAVVSHLEWDHDMAPWDAPPISVGDTPCTAGADGYLRLLAETIVPAVERLLPAPPAWRGLAGYSLAGLFALYALYQTAMFSRVASASGSLWFPGLLGYARSHAMKKTPERAYFSQGDQEARTTNPFLKAVGANTEAMVSLLASQGAQTCFQMNPGDHYTDCAARMAAGLDWLLR